MQASLAAPRSTNPAVVSSGTVQSPTGNAQPMGADAASTASRRILVRFKTGSPFASGLQSTTTFTQTLVDRTDREMPLPGLKHLKSMRLSHTSSIARAGFDKQPTSALAAMPSGEFEISVLEISDPTADRDQLIQALIDSGQVEYAEADVMMSANSIPNDPSFGSLWGLNNTGQNGGTVDADIDAVEAWDLSIGDASVVVAVIDTGVYYDHPDLIANMWRNPGESGLDASNRDKARNGIDDDLNGYIDDLYGIDCANGDTDPLDDNVGTYHGTHVAGTIGAKGNNNSQITGVNWDVSLMALKYLNQNGNGVTSDVIECLTYAANMKKNHGVNLRVSNNSYGGGGSTQAMRDAIQATVDQGILFIAAAGNDGEDNDSLPHFPSSYDLPGVVAVASIDRNDAKASSSNYGLQSVDLGAPGVSILSTVGSGGLTTLNGTSMASPHVAGVAALLAAYDPSLSWRQIKGRMLDTAVPIAALDGKTLSGGRVNAFDALSCSAGDTHMYITPLAANEYLELNQAIPVEISLTSCGSPVTGATVSVVPDNGQPAFVLTDDGVAPDHTAADGFYAASWTPAVSGNVSLEVTAVSAQNTNNDTLAFTVIDVPDYVMDPAYPYAWHDSSDGTDIGLGNVDDDGTNIAIGFDFNFYGISHNNVWVHSNGMMKFGADVEFSFFEFIDSISSDVPNNFISPLWEDLNPSVNSGAIYRKLEGEAPNQRLIVQWHDLKHFNQESESLPGMVTFQAILYEGSSDIVLQYQDVTFGLPEYDFGARALVGIERFDGADGLLYLNQGEPAGTSLAAGQAILFSDSGSAHRVLTVTPADNGSMVTDSGQINCDAGGAQCFGQYSLNSDIVLTASPASGYRLESWQGAGCDAVVVSNCTITMDSHKTVTANFDILPAVNVTPNTGLETNESGSTASFTVALSKLPSSEVTIELTSSDTTEGSVSPVSLVFTSLNGTQGQSVTVSGLNDAIDDGDVAYQITTAPAVSADPDFNLLDAADVSLTNLDDADLAGTSLVPGGGLITSESGGSDSFSVVLNSEPEQAVVINLASSDGSEGSPDIASLSFDAASWNQPQLVNVTGVDDEIDDGDVDYSIQLAVGNGSDSAYQSLLIPAVSVRNNNDDFAGISVNVGSIITTEAGGAISFTIELEASPQFPVNIALSSSDTSEGTISPGSISFDSGDWSLPKTITVTGVDDSIDDGDVAYSAVIAAATSAGADYAGLDAADLLLSNADDDTAGIVVIAVEPLQTDEAGLSADFSVVLNSEPVGDVDISLSISNAGEAALSSGLLRFTPLNAVTAQMVTVTGLDDNQVDGDSPFTVIIGPAVSGDAGYSGADPADLSGVNLDLDTDGDGDSIVDDVDNCLDVSNIDQMDSDFDLIGDACDEDDDDDDIADGDDNCPVDANTAQKDTDGDGLGDACDPDSDNDSVLDGGDRDPLDPYVCEDADADGCDDCSIGVDGFGELPDADPLNDGPDLDGDSICDVGENDDEELCWPIATADTIVVLCL